MAKGLCLEYLLGYVMFCKVRYLVYGQISNGFGRYLYNILHTSLYKQTLKQI